MKDKYIFIISCAILLVIVVLHKLQKSETFTPLPSEPKINIDFLNDLEGAFKNSGSSETYNLIINDLYTKPELLNQIDTCYSSISKDEMSSCLLDITNNKDMKDIIKKNSHAYYTNFVNTSMQQQFINLLINKYFPPLK